MNFKPYSILLLALFVLSSVAQSEEPVHSWSQGFGDGSDQLTDCVIVDDFDNIIIAGYFKGSMDLGGGVLTSAGDWDAYIAKFDPAGNHIWSKRFGDAGIERARSVAIDADGNILVGGDFTDTIDFGGGVLTSSGSNDAFAVKFDSSGNHIWSRGFGGTTGALGFGIAGDDSGSIVLAGITYGPVDYGGGLLPVPPGGAAVFVLKLDADGDHVWSHHYGNVGQQVVRSVGIDASGNIAVAGHFTASIDFGGGTLSADGSWHIFVAELDLDGNHLWSKEFGMGSGYYAYAQALAIDDSDNIVFTGWYAGTVDFGGGPLSSAGGYDSYIVKFDPAGNHVWSKIFGDVNEQYAKGITTDAAGGVIATGYFTDRMDFGGGPLVATGVYDLYMAKFDMSGNHLWSRSFGDSSPTSDNLSPVATDGLGNVILASAFTGSIDFGGGPLVSAGGYDSYLVKFWRPEPDIVAVRDVPGDEGGIVNLAWNSSGADTPLEHGITEYTVWRAIEPTLAEELISGGTPVFAESDAMTTEKSEAGLRIQQFGEATTYWTLISSVDAYFLEGYAEPVPTLFDSTAVCTEQHYFQVIAHTSDPYTYWISDPANGYSVDNLAPTQPMMLAGAADYDPEGLVLSWTDNTEPDLAFYVVHRGTGPGFTPEEANLIASPVDAEAFDQDWRWGGGYYYKVAAVDVHGNESPFTVLAPEQVSQAEDTPVPTATHILQNYPNPFNPETVITFYLGKPSDVTLSVFDVSGRLVRVLVNERREARQYREVWDGTDATGTPVASGVYYYRLVAGSYSAVRTMALLK